MTRRRDHRGGGTLDFLPATAADMAARGWEEVDVVLVTPDAYVDHPAFAAAVIGRVLEGAGFRVAILARPDWNDPEAFRVFGRPRLAFGISGGNVDSMLMHRTAAKKRRGDDPYAPGGRAGGRPERPTLVYSVRLKEVYPDCPQILGGVEASLRRFAHYDYWQDRVRRPLLADVPARLAVYGMGERPVVEILRRLDGGEKLEAIRDVAGTVWRSDDLPDGGENCILLPSAEAVAADPDAFLEAAALRLRHRDGTRSCRLVQPCQSWYVVENPPQPPESEGELDAVYDLPYTRRPHPMYAGQGEVPALDAVRFSLVSHRGCFGDCAFCALSLHQGKTVRERSEASLLAEARRVVATPGFKGRIHDVGGPTANMYGLRCRRRGRAGSCALRPCLGDDPCPELETDQSRWRELLARVEAVKGVRRVTVGSGLRHDLLLADEATFARVVARHVSGQLKVAPEHIRPAVTRRMGKPDGEVFHRFRDRFFALTAACGKEQYLVPYLMAAHPGCDLEDMVALFVEATERWGGLPEQVQEFIPTPGTRATAMYWTGRDPLTGETVHVARSRKERDMQRALLSPRNPRNRALVLEALRATALGRELLADGRARRLWPWLFAGSPTGGEKRRGRRRR